MKYTFLLALCLMSTSILFGQVGVKVGFKLQPDITLKMTNDEVYDDKNGITHKFKLFSLNYGAQVVINITDKIGLETGVYMQRQIFSYYVAYYDFTVRESFNFVQVPLLLRIDLSKIFFTVGTAAFYESSSLRDYSTGYKEHNWDKTNGKVYLGLVASVGRDWPITKKLNAITELRLSGCPGYGIGGNLGLNIGANYKF